MKKRQQSLFESTASPWEVDDQEDYLIARVVFSEPPFGPYDYRVPEPLRELIAIGKRVQVPLGRGNRSREAYCCELLTAFRLPEGKRGQQLKSVKRVVDREPLLDSSLLTVSNWISEYYLTPLGQVIETVVPSGVRSQAGTRQVKQLHVPNAIVAKLTQLQLPKKQADVLRVLAAAPTPLTAQQLALKAGCTTAPIQSLRKKGLILESLVRGDQ